MQWLAQAIQTYYVGEAGMRASFLISWAGAAGPACRDTDVNIPNLITLGRILLVPVIIWAITSGQMAAAFFLFVIAGVSDAVDGFRAKRLNMQSEMGALLDPLADKALLVSIYVAPGIPAHLLCWLVVLVVSVYVVERLLPVMCRRFSKVAKKATAPAPTKFHRFNARTGIFAG